MTSDVVTQALEVLNTELDEAERIQLERWQQHVHNERLKPKKFPKQVTKGGAGSGHFGHSGRPGKVGGSMPSGSTLEFAKIFIDELRKDDTYFVGSALSIEDRRNYLVGRGFTQDEVRYLDVLLDGHGYGQPTQGVVDAKLVAHLKDNDRIGQLAKEHIALEIALQNKHVASLHAKRSQELDELKNDFDWAWDRGEGIYINGTWFGNDTKYPEPKEVMWADAVSYFDVVFDDRHNRVYRRGTLSPDIQSWSRSESGAVMDREMGGIGWDHSKTYAEMASEGYIPINGWSKLAGAPGENETTYIKAHIVEIKGGPGSGHFGHVGRPGKIGGSGSKSGLVTMPIGLWTVDDMDNEFLQIPLSYFPRTKHIVEKQLPIDDASKHALIKVRMELFNTESDRLAEQVFNGDITIGQWQDNMKALIKGAHVSTAAIGKGGWDLMGPRDWGRIGTPVRNQYKFLAGFASTLDEKRDVVTLRYIQNRARLYGEAIVQSAVRSEAGFWFEDELPWLPRDGSTRCLMRCKCMWRLEITERRQTFNIVQATWVLGVADHCETCLERNGHIEVLKVPVDVEVPPKIGGY